MAQIKRTKRQASVDKAEHRNSCEVVSIEAAEIRVENYR